MPRCSFHWDDIFPIVDAPSARLMKIKAACLAQAGIITTPQKSEIDLRADRLMERVERHGRVSSVGDKRAA